MDLGSGFEEERYANSRYTLETKLIGLEGGLHVGVAEEGEKKRENLARQAETGALPTETIWGGGQTTSLAVRLLPDGDLFVA